VFGGNLREKGEGRGGGGERQPWQGVDLHKVLGGAGRGGGGLKGSAELSGPVGWLTDLVQSSAAVSLTTQSTSVHVAELSSLQTWFT
jgi:hypothetical protein